jgi:hypothetical protein
LLKERDSIENILQEFSLIKEGDTLHWVGILAQITQSDDKSVYDPLAVRSTDEKIRITIKDEEQWLSSNELLEMLEQKGFRYINLFLLSISNLLNYEDIYG